MNNQLFVFSTDGCRSLLILAANPEDARTKLNDFLSNTPTIPSSRHWILVRIAGKLGDSVFSLDCQF